MTTKMTTGPVVFAHGARFYSEGLIEAFQKALKGFNTAHCKTAEQVLALFEAPQDKAPIMLVIDDQLEHNGHFSDEETDCGTTTGTALCKVLRATVNPALPVILYTTRYNNFLRFEGYVDPFFVPLRVDRNIADRVINAARDLFPFAEPMGAVSRP